MGMTHRLVCQPARHRGYRSSDSHHQGSDQPQPAVRQELAARQCSNCMNRHETYLSMGHLQKGLDQLAPSKPDVQVDVGFGLYYGPASARKLYLEVHRVMEGGRQWNAAEWRHLSRS
jgi:hypothetical protein